ncbi:hypothetical protein [Pseudomonas viridiflava]|uniref:hypothetical protein n=1 Tax=Pseudomonas viridiflava TaxID=33069 RepID=UPI0013C337B8|nr:hypothetical protein [Pseudomonas viridiflava]
MRVYAANAWVSLASKFSADRPELIDRLEQILSDPSAAVRLQVAQNLQLLSDRAPDRMWEIAHRVASVESNCEIVASLLSPILSTFNATEPSQCESLLSIVKSRLFTELDCKSGNGHWLLESIANGAADLYVDQGQPLARSWLVEWVADPILYSDCLKSYIPNLRGALFSRYLAEANTEDLVRCDRAQDSLRLILRSLIPIASDSYEVWVSAAEDSDKQIAKQNYIASEDAIRNVMQQLYFGSGANAHLAEPEIGLRGSSAKALFLTHYAEELRLLAYSREPATLHHLIELYEFLIPGNPSTVFESIHAIIIGRGKEEGYHFEALAIAAVARIAQLYIADYREVFEDGARRAGLISILQVFSEAGWPEALMLLYELPDLLR